MFKYIIIIALGAISFGTLTSFAKIDYGQGYNAGEITFVQAVIGAIIFWSVVLFRNIKNGVDLSSILLTAVVLGNYIILGE